MRGSIISATARLARANAFQLKGATNPVDRLSGANGSSVEHEPEHLPELAAPNHSSHRKDDVKLLATNAKSSMWGLDLDIARTLGTSREPKRTLRSVDDDALSALVWIIDKLVKAYV
jgi:hypothetical protein